MSTICLDGRLVHTPPAKAREGLLGYVLRVSESNGYDSPWRIFTLAGLTQDQMIRAATPIDKLSNLIGYPADELAQLPWQRYPNGNPFSPQGRLELRAHLLLEHPKICPHCIAENGHVDIAWDLRIMLACPKHKIALVNQCPACHRKLTWFRPGLNRCRCGHHITTANHHIFPQHTIDLLQVIYDTLHGLPTDPRPPSGIPALDLQQMGIDDLLRLLNKVGNYLTGNKPQGKYKSYSPDRLKFVSAFFQDWPKQLHQFLRTSDLHPDQPTVGLARRFECFYRSIVVPKSIPREKMVFFRKAFGQYSSDCGVAPGTDPRFFLTPQKWKSLREQGFSPSQIRQQAQGSTTPTHFVNQTELARRLGVRTITARNWAAKGLFGLEHQGMSSNRQVYKTPQTLPSKVATGIVDVRKAAKYLGIPVSILVRLRRDGYYRSAHLGTYISQFNQFDLNKLREDILTQAPNELPTLPADHITLTVFFRMKLYGVENKYRIIRSILDGDLLPAGHLSKKIGDIVITTESIRSFRENMSIHETIPATRAAKILECAPDIFIGLVDRGELRGTFHGRSLYVTTESIEAFQKKYLSCVSIAKRLGTSSPRVVRLLSDQGSQLLQIQRTYRSDVVLQTFCFREEAEMLISRNGS